MIKSNLWKKVFVMVYRSRGIKPTTVGRHDNQQLAWQLEKRP